MNDACVKFFVAYYDSPAGCLALAYLRSIGGMTERVCASLPSSIPHCAEVIAFVDYPDEMPRKWLRIVGERRDTDARFLETARALPWVPPRATIVGLNTNRLLSVDDLAGFHEALRQVAGRHQLSATARRAKRHAISLRRREAVAERRRVAGLPM